MEPSGIIGVSVPRVDALEKVTGRSLYGADLKLPHMLCGKVLRSTLPHARILHVDTSRAERLPGVKAVATGKDLRVRYGLVQGPPGRAPTGCAVIPALLRAPVAPA